MNWPDERYVRVYTRDTPEWLLLSPDAQSLWLLLLRKFDRTGVIPLGRLGARAVAVIIGHAQLWETRYKAALDELVADGCVTIRDDSSRGGMILFAPNFQSAQEARASDRLRAQEYRDRKRSEAERASVVTISDDASRSVMARHGESHGVTPYLAVPSRTDSEEECAGGEVGKPLAAREAPPTLLPDEAASGPTSAQEDLPLMANATRGHSAPKAPAAAVRRARAQAEAERWVEWYNRTFGGRQFHARKGLLRDVQALLDEGATQAQMRLVAEYLRRRWQGDQKMREHLVPSTILARTKFGERLDAARSQHPDLAREADQLETEDTNGARATGAAS